jgi:hypothetical protein
MKNTTMPSLIYILCSSFCHVTYISVRCRLLTLKMTSLYIIVILLERQSLISTARPCVRNSLPSCEKPSEQMIHTYQSHCTIQFSQLSHNITPTQWINVIYHYTPIKLRSPFWATLFAAAVLTECNMTKLLQRQYWQISTVHYMYIQIL